MEWRCTWCGKPHEENDPPCDECGHHKFERAVEQFVADADGPRDPVWVCTECDRRHQKNAPPCSRCGNHDLERRDPTALDDDLTDVDTRWRDVLEPRYVAGYAAVAVLIVVLGLGLAGFYDLPGASAGPPAADSVPGNASVAGGHSLAAVEDAFVAAANDRRTTAGGPELARDETLDAYATHVNRRLVAAAFGEGERPDLRAVAESYDFDCADRLTVAPRRLSVGSTDAGSVAGFADEQALGAALYERWAQGGGELSGTDAESVGVDVHVVGQERVFVTVASC